MPWIHFNSRLRDWHISAGFLSPSHIPRSHSESFYHCVLQVYLLFSLQLCYLVFLTYIFLPLPIQHSQCSLTQILCLSLSVSLSDLILLSMSWRQIGCIQPGSCVLLVLCHNRCSLANPLSICLEELQDALSPETSALRLTRRVLYQKLHSVNTQK